MREDYPKTQAEFDLWFASEQACREYVARIRWPDGFICPRCKGGSAWIARRNRMVCAGCAYQASLTAGTIFQGTRKPLSMWLRAMWWVTVQKNGASALGLQQVLGLGHYGTAWTWLHKLRRAMVRPGRDRLGGTVEVDETYVGGKEKGARGRKLGNKALVAVAAEEAGAGTGRIRLKRVPDASAASLEAFILEAVEPGSAVRTDGWPSYSKLAARGYRHETRVTGGDPARTDREFPRVHRVASLLKRWLRIPMKKIADSNLKKIRSERSDAACQTAIREGPPSSSHPVRVAEFIIISSFLSSQVGQDPRAAGLPVPYSAGHGRARFRACDASTARSARG